jgi:predicted HicB family RNase H-like nuclease
MTVKLTLRVPEDLHARLAAAAKADQRSLNGEVLWLLTAALDRQEGRDSDA